MKILITGGFGYLGGRLARYLALQENYELILGSRTEQRVPDGLTKAKTVQIQWDSPFALQEICRKVDVIIHAAGMNAEECSTNPYAAFQFNALGTASLLQAAIQKGVKRFIYISTAHVYGSLVGTITEETCTAGLHPYAASHRAAEDMVRFAHSKQEIEGMVIRLSNAFGYPMHKKVNCWMLLVNELCLQAMTTNNMILKSSGLQRRDFIPIQEVCRALAHLLTLKVVGTGVFNLGSEWAPTVWEMAMLIQKRCESQFGFLPSLSRVNPKDERSLPLTYSIQKLKDTGFQLGEHKSNEIDELLNFCKVQFSKRHASC
jgi:UDP-glucose 4-epimerase